MILKRKFLELIDIQIEVPSQMRWNISSGHRIDLDFGHRNDPIIFALSFPILPLLRLTRMILSFIHGFLILKFGPWLAENILTTWTKGIADLCCDRSDGFFPLFVIPFGELVCPEFQDDRIFDVGDHFFTETLSVKRSEDMHQCSRWD